jgi:serine/threonine protein kinase
MKGGKLAAKGGFGCIFIPGLLCMGEKDVPAGTVTKLLTQESAENEMLIQPHLLEKDPEHRFFLYPEQMCLPSRRYKKSLRLPKAEISDCTLDITDEEARLVRYKFGGTDLDTLVIQPAQYKDFFINLGKLFDALALLHSDRGSAVYHLDIKENNIVCDDKMQCRFIDFGISDTVPSTTGAAFKHDLDRSIYPFDLQFIQFTFEGKSQRDKQIAVDKFWDTFSEDRNFFPRDAIGAKYEEIGLVALEEAVEKKLRTDFSEEEAFYKFIFSKTDVFSLGKVISAIWAKYTGVFKAYSVNHGTSTLFIYSKKGGLQPMRNGLWGKKNGFLEELLAEGRQDAFNWFLDLEHASKGIYTLVEHMLDMDPFARYTVERAAKLYKKICDVLETLFTEADIVKYMAPYADRLPYGEVKSKSKPKSKSKSKSKSNSKRQTRRVNSLELHKKASIRRTRSANRSAAVINRNFSNKPIYWKKYGKNDENDD